MTDKVKQIFELLGVKPFEEFRVKDFSDEWYGTRFFLDENLYAWTYSDEGEKKELGNMLIIGLLKDLYTIVKFPKK